jgi:hypothetical protein
LTYLAIATSVAFCYGFLRPRVAITAGRGTDVVGGTNFIFVREV